MQQKKPSKIKRLNDSNKSACSSSFTPLGKKTNHVFPVSAKHMTPFIMEGRQHPIRLRGDIQPKPTGSQERRGSWASPRHPNVLSKWVAFQLHSSLSRTLKICQVLFCSGAQTVLSSGKQTGLETKLNGKTSFPRGFLSQICGQFLSLWIIFLHKVEKYSCAWHFPSFERFRLQSQWSVSSGCF